MLTQSGTGGDREAAALSDGRGSTGLDAFASEPELADRISQVLSNDWSLGTEPRRTGLSLLTRETLSGLYAYALRSTAEGRLTIGSPLIPARLFVNGFDCEQIWSQFSKFDRQSLARFKDAMSGMADEFLLLSPEVETQIDCLFDGEADAEVRPGDITELHVLCEKGSLDGDETVPADASVQENATISPCPKTEPVPDVAFEDGFLRMREMEDFLNEAEDEEFTEETDPVDIDLLAKLSDGQETEEEDPDENTGTENDAGDEKAGREIMYGDMFGPRKQTEAEKQGGRLTENSSVMKTKVMEEREVMEETIRALEEEAIGEKEWPFRGEISASDRPLNSALEVDLDYDTTVKPPPKPTQADMDSIEELIKRRIGHREFDDVERQVPPPIEETKHVLQLDDAKAKKGLGELYEDAYVRNTWGSGTLEEKEEKLRAEARQLFREACAKLDAITHFHFAPRPVVEELRVKKALPSIQMEEKSHVDELQPTVPEQIYHPVSKTGEVVGETEHTKLDRKHRRAKVKRSIKASRKAETASEGHKVIGRKSEVAKRGKKLKRSEKEPSVFEKIQSHQAKREQSRKKAKLSAAVKL